jgi:hypothetical protein
MLPFTTMLAAVSGLQRYCGSNTFQWGLTVFFYLTAFWQLFIFPRLETICALGNRDEIQTCLSWKLA